MTEAFERLAREAMESMEFAAFQEMMLKQFGMLAERSGRYISRMCNRDRELVLENALSLAWTLREEFNPAKIDLIHFWDECLQGAIRMQKHWFVRNFDGWRRTSSDVICSVFGLPAYSEEDDE
ncbi:MAG TPA: hypothetical protein VFA39_15445 [Steroidobacteraceae bacterium]|nr:hypothetical protein [Steroidobacteraceae bacterium]